MTSVLASNMDWDLFWRLAAFTETAEFMSCLLLSSANSALCQAAVGEAAPGMNWPLLDAANRLLECSHVHALALFFVGPTCHRYGFRRKACAGPFQSGARCSCLFYGRQLLFFGSLGITRRSDMSEMSQFSVLRAFRFGACSEPSLRVPFSCSLFHRVIPPLVYVVPGKSAKMTCRGQYRL